MSSLNLDQLQTFCQVARRGSFSAAADSLGLSQPAVSQQIRQLEAWFGVRLLERTAKGMKPTAAGAVLLSQVPPLETVLFQLHSRVSACAEQAVGQVSLGTGATVCIHLMPPVLQALRQSHPQLTVSVRTGNTLDILRAVEENRLDGALVTLPADSRQVALTPLFDDDFVVICPPDAPNNAETACTPAHLSTLPLIIFEPGSSTRKCIDNWFSEAGVIISPVMELGSIEAIKSMVSAGMGYSIIPRMALAGAAARPLSPPLSRTLALALRHDKPVGRGLRAVLQQLENTLAQRADRPVNLVR